MINQEDELMQILSMQGYQITDNESDDCEIYDDFSDSTGPFSHVKPYDLFQKTHQTLKVCAQNGYEFQTVPTIRLQGKWLEKLGFESGRIVEVRCEKGKLTIKLKMRP